MWEKWDTEGWKSAPREDVPGWLQVVQLQLLLMSQSKTDKMASCTNYVITQNRTFPSYLVPVKIPIPRYCFPGWVTHPLPEPGFNMSP